MRPLERCHELGGFVEADGVRKGVDKAAKIAGSAPRYAGDENGPLLLRRPDLCVRTRLRVRQLAPTRVPAHQITENGVLIGKRCRQRAQLGFLRDDLGPMVVRECDVRRVVQRHQVCRMVVAQIERGGFGLQDIKRHGKAELVAPQPAVGRARIEADQPAGLGPDGPQLGCECGGKDNDAAVVERRGKGVVARERDAPLRRLSSQGLIHAGPSGLSVERKSREIAHLHRDWCAARQREGARREA